MESAAVDQPLAETTDPLTLLCRQEAAEEADVQSCDDDLRASDVQLYVTCSRPRFPLRHRAPRHGQRSGCSWPDPHRLAGVHMWPSWTFDRTQRSRPLRVPAGGRTAGRRSDATHSDGGSTVLLPGPEPDRGLDRNQARAQSQDLLVLRFSGVWRQVQCRCCVLAFPTDSVERDLTSHTERPRPSRDSHVLSDTSTDSLVRLPHSQSELRGTHLWLLHTGASRRRPAADGVAAEELYLQTSQSHCRARLQSRTTPSHTASYLNPDVQCPPAAAQIRHQHPDVSRPPGPEQTRMMRENVGPALSDDVILRGTRWMMIGWENPWILFLP